MRLHTVYFSAKGTTKICADFISEALQMETRTYDWLKQPCAQSIEISSDEALLFAMPVYGGFIPERCVQMAKNLKGSHTPAILAAVYGNRHYDNALLQMKDLLTAQGFCVIAAGAFLAEHSIFPAVAAGRPDAKDKEAMAEFAAKCRGLLAERGIFQGMEIQLPGDPAYDPAAYKGVALKPDGDETCVSCKACVEICPQGAISADAPRKTDDSACISCGACIKVCPTGARNYHGEAYQGAGVQFAKKCAAYREPEMYYISKSM